MISGIVMNGPTPIMSIMLSAVASRRPMPRTSSACGGSSAAFMSRAQQVHIQADGAGNTGRHLAEKRVPGVDVQSLAELRAQQAAFQRRLVRVMRGEQG